MRAHVVSAGSIGALLSLHMTLSVAAPAPCSVLSTSQVGAALGVSVSDGSPIASKSCVWNGIGKPAGRRAMFNILTLAGFANGKAPLPGSEKPAVKGLGDEAYFKYFSAPRYDKVKVVDLDVKKGEQVFGVEVWGLPLEEAKAAAKALAVSALSKF